MNKTELKEIKVFFDKAMEFAENIVKFAAESEDKRMLKVLIFERKMTLKLVDFKKWDEPEEGAGGPYCSQRLL